ncbi:cytochrome c1 precursor [mine drainage metagenome]|uniref:Cytochrome c1 n=1 Tax=mine drainage metagenome TaxID=410659 RepID=A0A1J5QMA7_9ZZZZ
MNKLILILSLLLPVAALAEEGVHLDHAPINGDNQASLQRGAKVFVNYCLNCHSAASMRYNRLHDIGLTDEEIKENLIFTGVKVGETMTVAMDKKEAKTWFGATPPDLSVIARARGADWLYTYLRGFYRDETRPTGWNNVAFDKVGMPHVLWQLQGEQHLQTSEATDSHGNKTETHALVLAKPGKLSPGEYDMMVADLVNYLVFMAEPAKGLRMHLGLIVLLFLGFFFVVARALKKEFWKDVH